MKNLCWEVFEYNCEGREDGGKIVFSTLGGKRYCGDKDAVCLKCCRGGESKTECEVWGLCMFIGGNGRIYCRKKARKTEIFFGASKEDTGVCYAAGLGGTPFRGKNSFEERGAAGKNMCVLGYFCMGILGWESGGTGEIFEEGMKAPRQDAGGW